MSNFFLFQRFATQYAPTKENALLRIVVNVRQTSRAQLAEKKLASNSQRRLKTRNAFANLREYFLRKFEDF
jgi:hypothetical protein